MAYDDHANFAYTSCTTSPGTGGTSVDVVDVTHLPTPPFNATVWPNGQTPIYSNSEIVRVTAIAGNTLTITRTQEGTTAVNLTSGYRFAAGITKKTVTDLEAAITALSGGGGSSVLYYKNLAGISIASVNISGITGLANNAAGGLIIDYSFSNFNSGSVDKFHIILNAGFDLTWTTFQTLSTDLTTGTTTATSETGISNPRLNPSFNAQCITGTIKIGGLSTASNPSKLYVTHEAITEGHFIKASGFLQKANFSDITFYQEFSDTFQNGYISFRKVTT